VDSLTQIILGAACGEIVAGKKIGNRAMLWGAVGGTIPDLDVFATFFTDEITSTSFHRGFMHSFPFAVLAPWLLAWLVRRFYTGNIYQKSGYKAVAGMLWFLFYTGAALGINFIPVLLGAGPRWYILLPTLLLGGWFGWKLWRDYWQSELPLVELPYRTWAWLFFWSIFTHPVLDCFTNWGTQIWQPFDDLRVQWCTVSVVDPICSLPFGICLLIVSRLARTDRRRAWWNWAGLVWFCGYLCLYTVWHKQVVNRAFEQKLADSGLDYQRYYTNPTIFNNIVWSCLAEGDTAYYFGLYGFNDRVPGIKKLSVLPKRHDLLNDIPDDDRAKQFLRWFSDGYFNVKPYRGDTLQVNDLRFGLLGDSLRGNNYVFPFLLFKNKDGAWDVLQNNRSRENMDMNKRSMSELWERVQGEQ